MCFLSKELIILKNNMQHLPPSIEDVHIAIQECKMHLCQFVKEQVDQEMAMAKKLENTEKKQDDNKREGDSLESLAKKRSRQCR